MFGWKRRPRSARFDQARIGAWNTKVLGAVLARQCYGAGLAGPGIALPPEPEWVGLHGCLCRQADHESHWLHHWCGAIGMVPYYHRKVWETAFVAQAMWEAGAIGPGKSALGFAVGQEAMPGFLAARGMDVLATDLHHADPRSRGWIDTGQHKDGEVSGAAIHAPSGSDAAARLSFRAVDMKRIPRDLHGQFDVVWSMCALEHLGSIGAGSDFILAAMRCLKPGGLAIHTTEFDLDPGGPPLDRGNTVLFQAPHIQALGRRLGRAGHLMLPMDLDPGAGLLDQFVDLPPYGAAQDRWPLSRPVETPHLRAMVLGRIATSVGLIVKAGG
jgi:SAM-dependent methyltransferase